MKNILLVVLILPFILALVFKAEIPIADKFGVLVGYLVSIHWVYSFVFNVDMHLSFKTAKPGDDVIRIIGCGLGLVIGLSLWFYIFM